MFTQTTMADPFFLPNPTLTSVSKPYNCVNDNDIDGVLDKKRQA